jgi:hypothetical protein
MRVGPNLYRENRMQREVHVKTEAEIRVMWPQAQKCVSNASSHQKLEDDVVLSFPQSHQKEAALPTAPS